MDKNSPNFSMEDAMRFANSPAGKQLFAMLQRSGNPGIQKAMEQVRRGDMDGAKATLRSMGGDPDIQKMFGEKGG